MTEFSLDFPYALGRPGYSADFRIKEEDFIVNEDLGFEPSGEGEHLFVKIKKQNENTHWISENIARMAGVKPMDVGYCGKKDRFAITTQWFSVYDPKFTINESLFNSLGKLNPDGTEANCEVLAVSRHGKKLRRGDHLKNAFELRLRNVTPGAEEETDSRLKVIQATGVPNYFGEQRFGRDGNNLNKFDDWVNKTGKPLRRNEKSMVLSAARSWLFNSVLAARVKDESWTLVDDGPLWGRGRLKGSESSVAYESPIIAPLAAWCDVLEHSGLNQERRPLVLFAEDFTWRWENGDLVVSFALPAGQYATSVLREIVNLNKPSERL